MITVLVKKKDGKTQTFSVKKDICVIGRGTENDITLDEEKISRRHAAIKVQGHTYYLKDLNSSNGTFLNGSRLKRAVIVKPGDPIKIGSHLIRIKDRSATVEAIDFNNEKTVIGSSYIGQTVEEAGEEETRYMSGTSLASLYSSRFEKLFVISGYDKETKFVLSQQENFIGRKESNTVCLSDASISKRHALISRNNSTYSVRDLGSKNGTFVNSNKITAETFLHPGDTLQLGDIRLLFGEEKADQKAQPLSAFPKKTKRLFWALLIPAVLLPVAAFFFFSRAAPKERISPAPPPPVSAKIEKKIQKKVIDTELQSKQLYTERNQQFGSKTAAIPVEERKPGPAQKIEQPSIRQLTAEKKKVFAPKSENIDKAMRFYIDGKIQTALTKLTEVAGMALPDNASQKNQANELYQHIRKCQALFSSGKALFLEGNLQAALPLWEQLHQTEIKIFGKSPREESYFAKNISIMLAKEIYKQADIALQENKPEQAIQYCQEVLKTIPDHQGCLAIQKQFKKE